MSVSPFRPNDFEIAPTALFLGELVGKGNFSKVYKGLYLGNLVAIKKQEITDAELEKYLINELAILRYCNHPNIVKYVGASRPKKDMIWSITEYIPGGDLRMLLNSKIAISWPRKVDILLKLSDAIHYLHDHFIIHRDIKTDNMMLTLDLTPKLIDLGFARMVEKLSSGETPNRAMTCLGTDEFMAPELTFSMPYYLPADVYSFGITIVEVCTNKIPKRTPQNGFCLEWDETKDDLQKSGCPSSLALLVEQTAADDANDRLDMKSVNEWLEELHMDLKSEISKNDIHLSEDEILKTIQARWAEILKSGEDSGNQKIDPSDLETGFLANDIPEGKLNAEMKARRISVNKALKKMEILDDDEEEEEMDDLEASRRFQKTGPKVKRMVNNLNRSGTTKSTLPRTMPRKTSTLGGSLFKSNRNLEKEKILKEKQQMMKVDGGNPKQTTTSVVGQAFKQMNQSVTRLRRISRKKKPKRARTFINDQPVDFPMKAGLVFKKQQFGFVSWKKEFLVLTNEGILIFNSEEDQKKNNVKGALLFMDMVGQKSKNSTSDPTPAVNVSIAVAGKPYCFQVITTDKRALFQAMKGEEKDEWLAKINEGFALWTKKQNAKKENF